MTVRRPFAALLTLVVLLITAGCGGDSAPAASETDEPQFIEGKRLEKQGKNPEALVSFLRVIDKRGELPSPESHFEAGEIYFSYIKDNIEAIHHYQRYLVQQPNSGQAKYVRDRINTAKRELWRSMPGRPLEDQSVRIEGAEEVEQLRRENAELRAEIATLRGGAAPLARVSRPSLLADPRATSVTQSGGAVAAPLINVPQPRASQHVPDIIAPPASTPSPVAMRTSVPSPTLSKTRNTPSPTPQPPSGARGKTYTVKQGDGLYAIARAADPKNPGKKLQEIIDVNPELLSKGSSSKITPGMVLRIP
jgi:hypothetical protein